MTQPRISRRLLGQTVAKYPLRSNLEDDSACMRAAARHMRPVGQLTGNQPGVVSCVGIRRDSTHMPNRWSNHWRLALALAIASLALASAPLLAQVEAAAQPSIETR
jgi:hypothetical protein